MCRLVAPPLHSPLAVLHMSVSCCSDQTAAIILSFRMSQVQSCSHACSAAMHVSLWGRGSVDECVLHIVWRQCEGYCLVLTMRVVSLKGLRGSLLCVDLATKPVFVSPTSTYDIYLSLIIILVRLKLPRLGPSTVSSLSVVQSWLSLMWIQVIILLYWYHNNEKKK